MSEYEHKEVNVGITTTIPEQISMLNQIMGKLESQGKLTRSYFRDRKAEDRKTNAETEMLKLKYLPKHAAIWSNIEALIEDCGADWGDEYGVSQAEQNLSKAELTAKIVDLFLAK